MPLDTGLLYGEMVASAIAHIAIPFAVVLIIGTMPYMVPFQKSLVFIGLVVLLSFLSQIGFLMILQVNACSGLNNFSGVIKGSVIAAIITAVMIAIPVFIEPMRVMISQYFIKHRTVMTGEAKRHAEIIVAAAGQMNRIPYAVPVVPMAMPVVPVAMRGGGSELNTIEYEDQTLREISAGTSYWGAFAGAYGVAFGSLVAATCMKSSS